MTAAAPNGLAASNVVKFRGSAKALPAGVTEHALMGGDRFRQYPATDSQPALVKLVKQEAEGDEKEQIMFPGELSVPAVYEVRGVTDDGTASREVESNDYQVEFTAPGGVTAGTAVDDAELGQTGRDRSKWVRRVGLGPYLNRSSTAMVDHAVKAFAADRRGVVRPVTAYSSSGLFVTENGRHAFLRAGRPALTGDGPHAGLHTRLPAGLFRDASWADSLSYPDPSPAGEAGTDALLLWGTRQAAPGNPVIDALLCQLATAPLVGLREIKPLAAILYADSGTGKGIVQAISVGLQSGGIFVPSPAAWDPPALSAERLTALALRSRLHHLRGYVVTIIDVFQEGQTPKERDTGWSKVNMAARSAADASGGGAMMRNGTDSRIDRIVRACITFDAEELPDAASRPGALGRAFVVRLEGDPFQVKAARAAGLDSRAELDTIYASLPQAGRALGSMLTHTLADLDKHGTGARSVVRAAVEWGRGTAAEWRIDGHSRMVPKYGQMLAGAYLLGEHLGAVADLDPAHVRAELVTSVRTLAEQQAATVAPASRTRRLHGRSVDDWVRILRRVLEDGRTVLLSAPEGQGQAPGTASLPPGRSLAVYGWRRGPMGLDPAVTGEPVGAVHGPGNGGVGRRAAFDYGLWMFPEGFKRLHDAVAAEAHRKGIALPDAPLMRKELETAGYLMPAKMDELWGTDTRRVLKLDLGRVLTLDDDQEEGGPGPAETPPVGPTPVTPPVAPGAPVTPPAAPSRPCEACPDRSAEWCGRGSVAGEAAPCIACGRPTRVRSACGAARTARCAPEDAAPAEPTPQRAAQRDGKPIIGRAKRPGYALDIPLEVELNNFAQVIRADDSTRFAQPVDREALAEGLDLFHKVTDWTGIEAKSAGRIGHQVLHRLTARSGSTADMERVDMPAEVTAIKPKLLDPRWVNAEQVPVIGGEPVVALDVNGQFLAATGCALGAGLPRHSGAVEAAELMMVRGKLGETCGYGQLADDVQVPGIPQPLKAGDWLVMPTLRYLVDDLGMPLTLADSWVWDSHNRRLNNFYEFWRDARYALLGIDGLPAVYARAAVKSIPNTFVGGWMRSPRFNNTDSLRIDWSHHIIGRSRVNALRAIRRAGVAPVAMVADTAYLLGMAEAQRMEISTEQKLGKWKVEKLAPVTDAIVDAHARGLTSKFRDAVSASHLAKGDVR